MDTFTQLLIATISVGLMMFGAVYLVVKKMLDGESIRRDVELMKSIKDITLPLRLQAHERLLMFLERISPEALVLRLRKPQTTNAELHAELIASVRSEFEHNLSQQLYISIDAWNSIVAAKNGVMNVINSTAVQTEPTNSSMQLAQALIERFVTEEPPTASAIKQLKKDVAKLF